MLYLYSIFDFILKGDSYQCVLSRLHIFNLRCIKMDSNAKKLEKMVDVVQYDIENNGCIRELKEVFITIGCIHK